MRALLRAGADKVSLNSAAVRDPDAAARAAPSAFGTQCIVVAIDARRRDGAPTDGRSWSTRAGPRPGATRCEWAAEATAERGAGEILLTSMDRDGTGEGYDLELLEAVGDAVTVPVVASGGAGEPAHFAEGLPPGGPTRCSPRAASTTATSRSAR